ncbi:M81 family metallopeptidase [Chelativorans sp. Marseille-P2723]|uniref:M81 family metallopeptidase n=1 Tax=Chelativorans sp. Marseille-P2723 TaxID=2709133 RepID=UPI00156D5389|nr:M81 family metallopeptidase [Chelativorans sp. Marseille-P2723]
MKIAIAGFQHETNSFAGTLARRADFDRPGGWPPFCVGEEMMAIISRAGTPASGAIAAATEASVQLLPLLWCIGLPSGPVEDDAFEDIAGDICEYFREALADGAEALYLDLHGAMATPSWPDAEGELLARLRRIAPAPFPIAASFDLHGNISEAMVRDCTLLDCYRTYPHTDLKETGARVMKRLIQVLKGAPPPVLGYRPVPYLASINDQCTLVEPTRSLLAFGRRLEDADGVDCVSQFFGFPLADIPDSGPSIIVQGSDAAAVECAADAMLAEWIKAEPQFATSLFPADEAVAEAMQLAADENGSGPVVIADTQDNPGGGGTGDTTGMLHALLKGRAKGAVLVHIADAAACKAAHKAGEGNRIDIAIGASLSAHYGAPVEGPWKVLRLGSGSFTGIGPMYRDNPIALGPVALLEREGVMVIVAPRKMQASEPGLLLHLGLVPEKLPVLVVKSSVHFRGAYQTMARAIIPALAPGAVEADLSRLPYRHALRKPARSVHQP